MNNIDKNIFKNYETAETALLNELATEAKNKGKKARTLKGERYYVEFDGVWYEVTPEQCRIRKLIRNNFNMFVEQFNSAKSDILGVWKNACGERLSVIIADLEKAIEICQKYLDAFKAYITKSGEENGVEENVEENEVTEATENVVKETSSDAPETISDKTEGAETNAETCVPKTGTRCQDRDVDDYVLDLSTKSTSPTAPRTTKTASRDGTSCTTKTLATMP